MEVLEILGKEHGLIRQFLDNLNLATEQIEEGGHPPREFFEKAVEFSRNFSDKYHHFKEEYLLFGLLAMKKSGKIDAQIDSLKYQHERGRNLIHELANSLGGYSQEQEVQTVALLENMAAYISLLRQHIHKEDHIFYPMVEKEISEKENQDLMEAFSKEDEKMGGGFSEKNRRLVLEIGALL